MSLNQIYASLKGKCCKLIDSGQVSQKNGGQLAKIRTELNFGRDRVQAITNKIPKVLINPMSAKQVFKIKGKNFHFCLDFSHKCIISFIKKISQTKIVDYRITYSYFQGEYI